MSDFDKALCTLSTLTQTNRQDRAKLRRSRTSGTIHILVDSREQSVSLARQYINGNSDVRLGEVMHIRGVTLAAQLQMVLARCAPGDDILISVHYLSIEQLQDLEPLLPEYASTPDRLTLAAYACFSHIHDWCSKAGVIFLPNPYKQRSAPERSEGQPAGQIRTARPRSGLDQLMLERIWTQYRLMIAIISRSEILGDVCRQLILGQATDGGHLDDEYARALRYFKLGEPDMAGGSYLCEGREPATIIDKLRLRINKIAATDFNVLIQGESGSGKETIAWAIHELSGRRDKPFLAINCAGLPDELLESEMFGYMKGSHNQALEDSPGLLETVADGTLFLDELPDMSPRIQAKLLRCLESGEFRPLGAMDNRYTRVRIIAAGQPGRLNDPGIVRPDLKSRISQLHAEAMPLRRMEKHNPGTIFKIAFVLLERYTWTRSYQDNEARELTPLDIKRFQLQLSGDETLTALSGYEWRESNIRELNNFLRQWIVFGDTEVQRLKGCTRQQGEPQPPGSAQLRIYDDQLRAYLADPQNRRELKKLLAQNPFNKLKEAYVRHLYTIYARIIELENMVSDMPRKPTQKELARLMGVTENTLSRYLK